MARFRRPKEDGVQAPEQATEASGQETSKPGRYEQVRPELAEQGVLYDASGAQRGPYRIHDPRNSRALPQTQLCKGVDPSEWTWLEGD